MSSTKPRIAALAAVVALLACSTRASASPLYLQFDGVPVYRIVTLNDPSLGFHNVPVYDGQSVGTLSAFPDFSSPTTLYTFCVDLADIVTPDQKYLVNLRSTNDGLTNGERIAFLYNTYGTGPIADRDFAAALQLAIWDELANNGQGQFSPGATLSYTIPNATVAADLAAFLAAANASSGAVANWLDSHVNVPEPRGFQLGQGFLAPPGSNPNVPEPSSLVLMAAAAMALGFVIRRRLRRA